MIELARREESLAGRRCRLMRLALPRAAVRLRPSSNGEEPFWRLVVKGDPGAEDAARRLLESVTVEHDGETLAIAAQDGASWPSELRLDVLVAVAEPYEAEVDVLAGAVDVRDPAATGVSVRTGTARLAGRVTSGTHRLRVETGSAEVALAAGSSVAFRAETGTGTLVVPGRVGAGVGGQAAEGRIGGGEARLEVAVGTGSVAITLSRAPEPPAEEE